MFKQSSDIKNIIKEIKMKGPFEFSFNKIISVVPKNSPGNFLLGYIYIPDNNFNVLFTGYAKNLQAELKKHLHSFSHFNFLVTDTFKEAYENECRLYHTIKDYTFLMNKGHPLPPEGKKWKCSVCGKNRKE